MGQQVTVLGDSVVGASRVVLAPREEPETAPGPEAIEAVEEQLVGRAVVEDCVVPVVAVTDPEALKTADDTFTLVALDVEPAATAAITEDTTVVGPTDVGARWGRRPRPGGRTVQ